MPQPRVFVSYSRKDQEITQRLVNDLHQAGAEVWVDVDGIQSGNFMQAIDKALAACEWMVLVLSPNALASEYVPEEIYTALHRVKQGFMKAVVPVLVEPCQPGSIPPQWDVLQRYDATQNYAIALAGILRAIGLSSLVQPAPTIPPDHFPMRLFNLGFTTHSSDGAAYILPPLCLVPAGPFLMGSDPKRDSEAQESEQPQHTETLPTYAIARYPVTVAEYACFVHAGYGEPSTWQSQLSKLDHPVVKVTWHDARAYAAWLTERTTERWSLPTEAQWEKGARGSDGRIYPWGDTFDSARCNTKESGIKATTPVGGYPIGASLYGAEDMAGNVWEWTSSNFAPYLGKLPDKHEAADNTEHCVLRGGSWVADASSARSAFRFLHLADFLSSVFGFRLVQGTPNS